MEYSIYFMVRISQTKDWDNVGSAGIFSGPYGDVYGMTSAIELQTFSPGAGRPDRSWSGRFLTSLATRSSDGHNVNSGAVLVALRLAAAALFQQLGCCDGLFYEQFACEAVMP